MIDRSWGFRSPSLAGGRVLDAVHLPAYSLFSRALVRFEVWVGKVEFPSPSTTA
jgi:hypothetical protein